MSSRLSPAAAVITWTFGAINIVCILGFFCLRRRTVFAIRVPEVILGGMIWKFISFGFASWMFMDPECPCVAATILIWLDWVANYHNILRKLVLLFRYELQVALDNSKVQGNAVQLDERNVYVRYRYILKSRWQFALMGGLLCFVGLGNAILLIIFREDALKPCLTTNIQDNRLYMWTIIVSWMYFPPLVFCSVWSTRKLKSYPKDNWKIGEESAVTSLFALISGIIFLTLNIGVPGNDNTLFWYLLSGVILSLLNFSLPLRLWRKSVKEIAAQELKQLASLSRLLRDATFLTAFDLFLRSEFSSENLYFWLEADKLIRTYQGMLPAGLFSEESSVSHSVKSVRKPRPAGDDVDPLIAIAAATECTKLGRQCIGERAPWQINISGYTEHDMENSVARVSEVLLMQPSKQQERELVPLVEDAFRCLIAAQKEVYDGLRKDPYPRFLLTPAFAELNQNDTLKRLLAAEKLEVEVQQNSASSEHQRSRSLSSPLQSQDGSKGRDTNMIVMNNFDSNIFLDVSKHQDKQNLFDTSKILPDITKHLQDSYNKSQSNSRRTSTADMNANFHNSSNNSRGEDESVRGDRSTRAAGSKPLTFEVSLPVPNQTWERHLSAMTQAARAENTNATEIEGPSDDSSAK